MKYFLAIAEILCELFDFQLKKVSSVVITTEKQNKAHRAVERKWEDKLNNQQQDHNNLWCCVINCIFRGGLSCQFVYYSFSGIIEKTRLLITTISHWHNARRLRCVDNRHIQLSIYSETIQYIYYVNFESNTMQLGTTKERPK